MKKLFLVKWMVLIVASTLYAEPSIVPNKVTTPMLTMTGLGAEHMLNKVTTPMLTMTGLGGVNPHVKIVTPTLTMTGIRQNLSPAIPINWGNNRISERDTPRRPGFLSITPIPGNYPNNVQDGRNRHDRRNKKIRRKRIKSTRENTKDSESNKSDTDNREPKFNPFPLKNLLK